MVCDCDWWWEAVPQLCMACSAASSFLLLWLPAFRVLRAPHPMRNVVNCAGGLIRLCGISCGLGCSQGKSLVMRIGRKRAVTQSSASVHTVFIILPWLLKPRTLTAWKYILDLLIENPFLFTEDSGLFQGKGSLSVDLPSHLQYSFSTNKYAMHPPQLTPRYTLALSS